MKTKAFTLIELLVVTATILVLVTLTAAAVSGARSSQRKNHTRVTISRINDILMSQWRTYPSQVGLPPDIRRRISGDLPANWNDVYYMSSNPSFPSTRAQKTYVSIWKTALNNALVNGLPNGQFVTDEDDFRAKCSEKFSDDECLFLAVMYGGFAGCLDCAGLRYDKDFRDTDGDGWYEFVDAWGSPISYILWPVGLEDREGNSFFDTATSTDTLTFSMRPFVFSAGPNEVYGIDMGGTGGFSNLDLGSNCGNPQNSAYFTLGSTSDNAAVTDNITNFDAEFQR